MFVRKNSKIVLSSAILAVALGLGAARGWAIEGVSKDVVTATSLGAEGSYCHLKFPAIDPISFGSDKPVLKSADTGDVVDYYGPCDHDPLGKEELTKQLHEYQLYMQRGHGGY
jgi:hypothetical protein